MSSLFSEICRKETTDFFHFYLNRPFLFKVRNNAPRRCFKIFSLHFLIRMKLFDVHILFFLLILVACW